MSSENAQVPSTSLRSAFIRNSIHFFERILLLFVGSVILGIWFLIALRMLSDRIALCELVCHPSLHIFVLAILLFLFCGLLWFIRRKSSFSGDRWRRRFLGILIPVAFYTWVISPWQLIPLYKNNTKDEGLKIFAWNVQMGNDNAREVIEMVTRQSPDIVVLIEVTPFAAPQLEPLKNLYPYNLVKPHRGSAGLAVYSRIPKSEYKVIFPGELYMPAIELTIDRSEENKPKLSLLSIHTYSPQPEDGTRIVQRNQQLKGIAQWASSQEGQVIAIGDFNITPWSPPYWRMLDEGKLNDSTWYRGYFPTWPSKLRMAAIEIDHALVSKNVKIVNRHVLLENHSSDHRPITLTIE